MRILSTTPTLRVAVLTTDEITTHRESLEQLSPTATVWVDGAGAQRFHVLVAAQYGRLIGFLALDATDGIMRIVDLAVSPHADDRDTAVAELIESGLDIADSAWGNVQLDPTSEALPYLVRQGWCPLPRDPRVSPRLELSGAGVQ